MVGLVGWQLSVLWRDYRKQVFGARPSCVLCSCSAWWRCCPALWFIWRIGAVRHPFDRELVRRAGRKGLGIGPQPRPFRAGFCSPIVGQGAQHGPGAFRPSGIGPSLGHAAAFEQSGAQSAALSSGGQLLASANSELGSGLLPALPSQTQLKQARSAFAVTSVDLGGRMNLRVLVPVTTRGVFEDRRILQLSTRYPRHWLRNAEAVQAVYRDYQELQLAREGLTRIYALTLTLTVLVALLPPLRWLFVMARRLSAPLSMLAEGTQAVAQGIFPRQAVYSRDELGS